MFGVSGTVPNAVDKTKDRSESSCYLRLSSQQECRPRVRVCLPLKPNRQEVRAKIHLTPRPSSLTGKLAGSIGRPRGQY